ncbi:MAG: hypothetical protein C4554_08660 [Dethiobacter sp.]|jgi:predicted phosphodiesterase|nr:MAG: hypothetical protein C4554_08660 [Dethiobacter sp.]
MNLNKKLFDKTKKIVFSLLFMILVIQFLSPANFSAGAFEFEASLKFMGSGRTFIHFPPLGKIIAPTHIPPLDFHLTLKNINLEEMSEFIGNFSQTGFWPEKIIREIKINIIKYITSLLLLAFFLGMASILLWTRHNINKKEMFWAGLVNILVLLFFLTVALLSFNMTAFSRAEYEGILEAAPWVLSTLQEGIGVIENIGIQFMEVVENISFLHKEIEKNNPLVENKDTKRILHVSDIHNNPAAFDFIQRIVETFDVEMIIDTGDLVDYGTLLEMELFSQFFTNIDIPYIFIPGNHESPLVVEQLKKIKNVTVLEEGIIEIAGLNIAGIADPASYSTAMVVADDTAMENTAKKLHEIVNGAERADIIAAHNPEFFKYLRNNNYILLGGHQHKPYIKKGENYIEINAGTTGASGIRGLKNLDINFSLILLNFRYSEAEGVFFPFSADLIKVTQFPLNFSFERFIFQN